MSKREEKRRRKAAESLALAFLLMSTLPLRATDYQDTQTFRQSSRPAPAVEVSAPSGPNRLFALIVPNGVAIEDLAGPAHGLMALSDARTLLRSSSDRATSSQSPIAALGVFDYVITP